ncbi:hypothetical protein HF086_006650 [Spodoptera exigua]|uniref:Uncharacterized protein n=1 Tax=Spodoptera exigua TaxID=7107 RepID=A0A922ME63_SPOEX|nr:hypothetical protein HF086_006650 [Spodoptera exigua]
MAVSNDILIHIPNKVIAEEPINGVVKYYLSDEIVYKDINLDLVNTKTDKYYLFEHNYPLQKIRQVRPTKTNPTPKEYDTYVVIKIKMLNKNTDGTAATGPENVTLPEKKNSKDIKRYHLEIKFKKPTSIFCLNKRFQTSVKVYPTADSPFPDDPTLSELDRTLMKLFSTKKHEINLQAELEQGCITPSRVFKISFVVANNTDIIISIKTVQKLKTN